MAKIKSVTERKTLNKHEKSILKEIRNKFTDLHLTQKDYLNYLKDVANANKKLEGLSKKDSFLGQTLMLSNKLEFASSSKVVERMIQKPKKVLDEGYETDINESYKSILEENLIKAFGGNLGVNELTSKQIKDLIKRNNHLSFLLHYHNTHELNSLVDIYAVTEDEIAENIQEEINYTRGYN